ncbi:substrate-binding domain-containing protein (plasmid) [Agrobacterium vitis]|uniref:molybdate ABC transporter substrate-binding protein n=1 Tax=Agrobacterium vitis TaxID=373 RepID=UPI0012E74A30|nr:substrate-binding domain-containing protein [Agrobacterium vitis]MVA27298.1 ABC transporter substrate-binding protein [Agrobacterium vitis]
MGETLKLMSTLAVEMAFKTWLLPAWRESGRQIKVEWSPTTVLMENIEAGRRADVVVLIDGPMAKLASAGIVQTQSVTPIATAGFGLGARAGTALPDISTPEKFKAALLDARSIVYSRAGASGIYFAKVAEKLGIADEINAKSIIIPAGFTGEKVISGEADIAVQQVSELMSVEGVAVIGPFPAELQVTTDFSAAIFADAQNPELAQVFLAHLTSSEAHEAYSNGGLVARFAPATV